MISTDLQKKIDRSIKLLQAVAPSDGSPVEIAYSGGKDSDVILQLAKESGINYRAIYKNTTIDPPGTIKHCRDNGVEILQPKESFFQLIQRKGLPSRLGRFCCEELKEFKVLNKCAMGVRKDESKARDERYNEPTQCRMYKNQMECVEAIYPILYWTKDDVLAYIEDRGIKCHPLYYDEKGKFHVERRLGCMGCPLQSRKKRLAEFKAHPALVKAWIRSAQKYIDTHPQTKAAENYHDGYGFFHFTVFYDSLKKWKAESSNLFGKRDSKAFLEEYFDIKL